jgi:hypothetical protein
MDQTDEFAASLLIVRQAASKELAARRSNLCNEQVASYFIQQPYLVL